jgi:hypothetical protein
MAVTVSLYNHTAAKFADGSFAVGDTYKVNLYSGLTFAAANETKAAAESDATQLGSANGYTQDTKALSSVAVTTVTTNDAKLAADNVQWTASGGAIGPAQYALVYNDTDTGKPPVLYINFGETKTADSGTTFNITWNANGIVTWTVS